MELEFDKEIDAILRRAGSARGVLVGDSPPEPKKHLDADVIAAFAENALPDAAKQLYTKHFADCDRCRRILTHTILMNAEADVTAADSAVAIPTAEPHVPWYVKLFKTQNLALAMGALVLVFGGLITYVGLQKRSQSTTADVAQVKDPAPVHSASFDNNAAQAANVPAEQSPMAAANTAANAANVISSGSAIAMSSPTGSLAPDSLSRSDADAAKEKQPAAEDKFKSADSVSTTDSKTVASAPAPPPATGGAAPGARAETKPEPAKPTDSKDDESTLPIRGRSVENLNMRDMPPAALKKSGPTRSGPMGNNQTQTQSNVGDMAVTRRSGGKTFQNRDGAWYDMAYHGQSTSDYRRGTDEYKKLDGGLRKIADSIGGTVVVVWKDKAYRIQ